MRRRTYDVGKEVGLRLDTYSMSLTYDCLKSIDVTIDEEIDDGYGRRTSRRRRRRRRRVTRQIRGRNEIGEPWINGTAYPIGETRLRIEYENGDLSEIDETEEDFVDALEAGYYEWVDDAPESADTDSELEDDPTSQVASRRIKWTTLDEYWNSNDRRMWWTERLRGTVARDHRSGQRTKVDAWWNAFAAMTSCDPERTDPLFLHLASAASTTTKSSCNSYAAFSHPACMLHRTPKCPERPGRLAAALDGLAAAHAIGTRFRLMPADRIADGDLLTFHSWPYMRRLRRLCEDAGERSTGVVRLDIDTSATKYTEEAAARSAGGALNAVDFVLGTASGRRAISVTRPPGHHAAPGSASGFCFYNNAALVARRACERGGLSRVAIVDVDVHHGDGTVAGLSEDARVLYVSTHQFPLYPHDGAGREDAGPTALNVTLPSGAGSSEFRSAFRAQALPKLRAFRPQLVVVSMGFDAHVADPLADLRLDADDYAWVTSEIVNLADREPACGGRVVSVLEGGYNLPALRDGVFAHLRALFSDNTESDRTSAA